MNLLFKLLMTTVFLNSVVWILTIPIWQTPDEQAHFAQIQDISEIGHVPAYNNTSFEIDLSERVLGTKRDSFGNNKFTYHPEYKITYSENLKGPFENTIINLPKSARKDLIKNEATQNPPLYYLLASTVYHLFSAGNLFVRVYAIRIFSSLLILCTTYISLKIGQIIFEKNKILPIALATIVSFQPMYVFSSIGILPDPLTNLIFSIIILLCLKIINEGVKNYLLMAVMVTMVIGSLTRQHLLITIPIVLVTLFYVSIKDSQNFKKVILYTFSVIILIYILAPFTANLIIVFRQFGLPEIGTVNLNLLLDSRFPQFVTWTIHHNYSEVLPWYWGVYRWLSFTVPHFYYQIINRIIAVCLTGLILKFIIFMKEKKITKTGINIVYLIFISIVYFLLLMIWDYFFYIVHGYSFGIQGRYYFPLIVANFAVLLYGFWSVSEFIFNKLVKYFIFSLICLMILYNDLSLKFITESYYQTSNLTLFLTQASQYKPDILKGQIIIFTIAISLIWQLAFLLFLANYIIKEKYASNKRSRD